jgi:integral membrane sensor domain MASE1
LFLGLAVTAVIGFLGGIGACAAAVFGLLLVGWVIGEVMPEGLEEALVFVGVGVVVVGRAASGIVSILWFSWFDGRSKRWGRNLTSCASS